MITIEQARRGTTVEYKGAKTIIISEQPYELTEGNWGVKTSLSPHGVYLQYLDMPESEVSDMQLTLMQDNADQNKEVGPADKPVIIEVAILDEAAPVIVTPELIKEKSADLLALTIKDIFDEKGLKAVKSAKAKAVKTRTGIEKVELRMKGELKSVYEGAVKKLTDHTALLYIACREVENDLETKITTHNTAKEVERKRLEVKQTARENKMYELGMTWNGTSFVGYSKLITKDNLFNLTDEAYNTYVEDLELLQAEASIAPPAAPTPVNAAQAANPVGTLGVRQGNLSTTFGGVSAIDRKTTPPTIAEPPEIKAFYQRAIPEAGVRIFITEGKLDADIYPDALLLNDRILESNKYVHVTL